MSRIVSVWLENWPISRFLWDQRRGRLPPSCAPVDPAAPFALAIEASGGPQIVAVNGPAAACGVVPGDRLADARAKAGIVQIRDAAPETDRCVLRALALWATRYSPSVTPWDARSGEDGFFLDVTGATHLFGGEKGLVRDLSKRLSGFGLSARIAVAGAGGATWALARFGNNRWTVLPPGEETEALKPLPIEALRVDPEALATLRRLGFRRIGDLQRQPRAPFAKRFGRGLLAALDGALGAAIEPLSPLPAPPSFTAFRPVLEPIVTQEAIVSVARDLMADLGPALERDGVGARRIRLGLFRVDGRAIEIPIGLAEPNRDPDHLARLVALRLERLGEGLDAGFGFEAVRLDVVETSPFTDGQTRLGPSGTRLDEARRRAVLIDVLRQRLGPRSLTRLHAVHSHWPERASERRRIDSKYEASGARSDSSNPRHAEGAQRPRPILMLAPAEPAEVVALVPEGPPRRFRWRGVTRRVAWADGPERIAAEWWRRQKPQPTRDYYVVEDEAGGRFWLYREGLYLRETTEPRWFLHGLFP